MPREFQGAGRHDMPELSGVLYVSESAVSAVAEQLARFRGRRFHPQMLVRRGLPLALARYDLNDADLLIDLDDPRTLRSERLRPSQVATRHRELTQPIAQRLFHDHPSRIGLRWWSTLEASWINVTIFAERVDAHLRWDAPYVVTAESPAVIAARTALGL